MLKKIIAIDAAYANYTSKSRGLQHFPVGSFRKVVQGDGNVDVIETLITLVRDVPDNDSAEALAEVTTQIDRTQYALEMNGCRVILCPAKRQVGGGFKQSDDQRLMIATLSLCLRLQPDFLVLVAADGDYAPMIWELRSAGIRTEVVANNDALASDLKRAAYGIVDIDQVFQQIKDQPDE